MISSIVGSITSTNCISPASNFAIGFVGVLLCFLAMSPYFIGNRLRRVAFLRRERLVKQSLVLFSFLYETLKILEKASLEITYINQKARLASTNYSRSFFKSCLFFICAVLLSMIFVIYTLFFSLTTIIFKSMIVWRGYRNILYFNVSEFYDIIQAFIRNIGLAVKFPQLLLIFYPVLVVLDFIANININYSAVNVPCQGAQDPVRLLVNICVAAFVVIIIQSDIAVLWLCGVSKSCITLFGLGIHR
jgi:hypothetical protein